MSSRLQLDFQIIAVLQIYMIRDLILIINYCDMYKWKLILQYWTRAKFLVYRRSPNMEKEERNVIPRIFASFINL